MFKVQLECTNFCAHEATTKVTLAGLKGKDNGTLIIVIVLIAPGNSQGWILKGGRVAVTMVALPLFECVKGGGSPVVWPMQETLRITFHLPANGTECMDML